MSTRKRTSMTVSGAVAQPPPYNHDLAKEWPADHVERRSVTSLIPYARNARTHSDTQISQLAASIREWGWTMPVLIDAAGGIIVWHGRVLAARILGLHDVPVMTATGWSEAKRRASVLADNKLAMNAGWDGAMLALELNALAAMAFDMSLVGFSAEELAELTADRTAGLTDPDAVPDLPAAPVSMPGDVWVLGKHRIICGDCTRPARGRTIAGWSQATSNGH